MKNIRMHSIKSDLLELIIDRGMEYFSEFGRVVVRAGSTAAVRPKLRTQLTVPTKQSSMSEETDSPFAIRLARYVL